MGGRLNCEKFHEIYGDDSSSSWQSTSENLSILPIITFTLVHIVVAFKFSAEGGREGW